MVDFPDESHNLINLSVEMADFPDESHNLVTWTKIKNNRNFTLSQQNLATGAWGERFTIKKPSL